MSLGKGNSSRKISMQLGFKMLGIQKVPVLRIIYFWTLCHTGERGISSSVWRVRYKTASTPRAFSFQHGEERKGGGGWRTAGQRQVHPKESRTDGKSVSGDALGKLLYVHTS